MNILGTIGPAYGSAFGQRRPDASPRATQTSIYGRPITIVYGTHRISGNVILSGWYQATKVGGIWAAMGSGFVQVALCEGPISELLAYWLDQTKLTTAGLDSIQVGTRSQAPWATLTASWPSLALGYGGTAVISESTAWTFKADGELSSATWEVSGLHTAATGTAQDVHPAGVIADLLTNAEYGLGLDTAIIDGYSAGTVPVAFTTGVDGTADTSFFNLCEVGGFKVAMALEEQRPAREIVEELATATDSLAVWSEGKLKMRPKAAWTHTVGAYTYDGAAALTPVYDLGLSSAGADFLADPGEDPITVERKPTKDTFNAFPVEWTNRSPTRQTVTGTVIAEPFNAYNPDIEDGTPDPVDVAAHGIRKADPVVLRCITRQAHASYVSNILASRSLGERNQYRFRLGWRYARLEPCDVVTLTDAGLELDQATVRLIEVGENQDGTFDIVAEDVSVASGVAGFLPLVALLDETSVYGVCTPAPCTATSTAVACSVYGGSGTVTYAWTKTSGTTFTITSPTAASTTFSRGSASGLASGVYRCTVTDSVTGSAAYAEVTVELEGA